jgi:hypothetical protein
VVSHISGVAGREFATDEDDFAEVFLLGWFMCGSGSPGTGAEANNGCEDQSYEFGNLRVSRFRQFRLETLEWW